MSDEQSLGWAPRSICTDSVWSIGKTPVPGTANSGMETRGVKDGCASESRAESPGISLVHPEV